jgi:hypothetical protein
MDSVLNSRLQTQASTPPDLEDLSGRWKQLGTSNWGYLLVVLFAFLAFSNSLGNFFLMDDFWHLNKIARMNWIDWWQPWSFSAKDNGSYWMAMHQIRGLQASSYFFRPLVTLTFLFTEHLGGGAAWAFHLSNVFLHILTSLVFLKIARQFLGKNLASLAATIIFAVHPVHCESVQWISANGDLLAGLFFALAFYGHLRARQSLHGNNRRWVILAAGSFILALGSKEMAIMFPVIAFFYDLLFYRLGPVPAAISNRIAQLHPRRLWRSKSFYSVLGIYAAISVPYLYNHLRVINGVANLNVGGNYMADWRVPGFFSAILVNLATYLWHFWTFFPLLPLDTRQAWQDSPGLVLALWGALILFYFWLGRKFANQRQFQFFCWWPVLTVMPALPILMSQRVLYIPSMGFCLLVGLLLKEKWLPALEKRELARWWVPAIVGACFLMTLAMNRMWNLPSLMIRNQIEQITQELPSPESGSRIYLLDIWQPSYGIEEGLRRRYKDRTLDIQILSFSPKILEATQLSWNQPLEKLFATFFPEACGPLITHHRFEKEQDSTPHLHLELEGSSYFHSLVEGLLPVETDLGKELTELKMEKFNITLKTNTASQVNQIDFYFKKDDRKSYFLFFENGRYRRIAI